MNKHLLIIIIVLTIFSKACNAQRQRDTIRVAILYCDTTIKEVTYWDFAYSVREKHNTAEEEMDAGGSIYVDRAGNVIPCYYDYWVHLEYLDNKKKPLSKNYIVWQRKDFEP